MLTELSCCNATELAKCTTFVFDYSTTTHGTGNACSIIAAICGFTQGKRIMTTATATTLLTITSVPADTIGNDQLQIISRWKNTDAKPIAAANRVRTVILPANIWKNENDISHVQLMPLRLHILDSIAELAKDYLSSIIEESNHQRTQVPLESFTLTNLLAWQQERAALSGRLNGDEIKNWLTQSTTIANITTKHGKEIAAALGDQFVKLASPNHGLTPEKAAKILANIWDVADTESNTGLRVQLRLTAITQKNTSIDNVLDSIL